ncbi:MAG: DUF4962 domain-containing protein [Clostridia bacterium]
MKDINSLIFIGDLEKYTSKLDTDYKIRYERLLAECENYFGVEIPKEHPKKSTTYMGITIVNLALCYRLTLDEKYLNEARRWINGVLAYEKWGYAHMVNYDLSASWILWGLSLGFDWLEPYLEADEKEKIYNKIAHHVKIMYDYILANKKDWPVDYCQNHNWINLNGIATSGYVMKKHKGEGQEYIDIAIENFKKVFELMPEDGSNYEGVTYWRYGGMWLFVYAHLAKVESNINFFETSKYLENTFFYRLYQSAGNMALQVDFGDCHDRYSCHPSSVYYKTAAEYKNGYAQHFGNLATTVWLEDEGKYSKVKPGILPEAGLEFIFFDPSVEPKEFNDLPKQQYFEDLGLVAMRSGFDDNARVFSYKCGYPGGKKQWEGYASGKYEGMTLSLSHHHPDNTSYVFCNGKEYFTREDGYNRNLLPMNHSVLLVDGRYTDVEDDNDIYTDSAFKRQAEYPDFNIATDYHGKIECVKHVKDLTIVKSDNTKIYPLDLKMKEVSRSFIANEALDFVIFIDKFASEDEHIFSVVCNTESELVGDAIKTMPMGDKEACYIATSADAVTRESKEQKIVAVMTTQEPDKVCKVDICTQLTSSAKPIKEQVMVEVIAFSESATISYEGDVVKVCTKDNTYEIALSKEDAKFSANGEVIEI